MDSSNSVWLDKIDATLDEIATNLALIVSKPIVAEIERNWSNALTAAVDTAALTLNSDPSSDDVQQIEEQNKRAAYLAALFMLFYLGFSDVEAARIISGVSSSGSLTFAAITTRLTELRTIIGNRVLEAFGFAVGSGKDMDQALADALRQATNSARIFAELEALSAINGGIGSLGDYMNRDTTATTKTWRTRRDNRVRETHAGVEGQEVPYNNFFNVAGWPMEFPGDRRAPANLWANCRCIVVLGSAGKPTFL